MTDGARGMICRSQVLEPSSAAAGLCKSKPVLHAHERPQLATGQLIAWESMHFCRTSQPWVRPRFPADPARHAPLRHHSPSGSSQPRALPLHTLWL